MSDERHPSSPCPKASKQTYLPTYASVCACVCVASIHPQLPFLPSLCLPSFRPSFPPVLFMYVYMYQQVAQIVAHQWDGMKHKVTD